MARTFRFVLTVLVLGALLSPTAQSDPERFIGNGDINVNQVPFEVADVVLFTNYQIYGLSAFPPDRIEQSIAQSDVNGDGLTLTMADWVMLFRVLIEDTIPDPAPVKTQSSAEIVFTYDTTNGVFSMASNTQLAKAMIRVPGAVTVTPLVVAPPGGFIYGETIDGSTLIQVTPGDFDSKPIFTQGPLFQVTGNPNLSSIQAADWSGFASPVTVIEGSSCCFGQTGDLNGDFNRNLTDLTVLVNHLFVTFNPLACPAAGNTSGDAGCELNLTDLTELVNMLFVNFEPVADCLATCE